MIILWLKLYKYYKILKYLKTPIANIEKLYNASIASIVINLPLAQ